MKKRIALKGVEYASKLLGLEEIEVHFMPRDFFNGLTSGAIFIPDGYYIVFCEEWLETAEITEVLLCSFHETRHAYQRACIEYPKIIIQDSETVKKWKDNFNDYKYPQQDGYWNQDVEVDANEFSENLLRNLLTKV